MSDLAQRLRLNATIPMVMEAADRIEAMETALRTIADPMGFGSILKLRAVARAALAPEKDK